MHGLPNNQTNRLYYGLMTKVNTASSLLRIWNNILTGQPLIFRTTGIGHGDMVMLILKRRYEFWFSIVALHKLGAVILQLHLLTKKDIVYRCNAADIKMIVAAGEEVVTKHIIDVPDSPTVKHLVGVGPEIPEKDLMTSIRASSMRRLS